MDRSVSTIFTVTKTYISCLCTTISTYRPTAADIAALYGSTVQSCLSVACLSNNSTLLYYLHHDIMKLTFNVFILHLSIVKQQ